MTFSNTEKFVNENSNYADSQTLLDELQRRGYNVGRIQKKED